MFTYDLNDWVMVDEKSDGWREVPVHWPALPQPKGTPLKPPPPPPPPPPHPKHKKKKKKKKQKQDKKKIMWCFIINNQQ